ncbi:MAG: uroporphyrinogen decarboxylase family protein, partial [Thermodesulfobacteriota bacterium]
QYSVKGHPYAEGVDNLSFPANFLEKGRFPVYKENLKLLKKKVGEELVMFGESEGAFTCAANLVGTELFMKWCMKKADLVVKTLE